MFSQTYYLVRSRIDGSYLAAYPKQSSDDPKRNPAEGYVLLFQEHFEALSYLNQHGADRRDRFSVESVPGNQLGSVLTRWGFKGFGIVKDPLLPTIEFVTQA